MLASIVTNRVHRKEHAFALRRRQLQRIPYKIRLLFAASNLAGRFIASAITSLLNPGKPCIFVKTGSAVPGTNLLTFVKPRFSWNIISYKRGPAQSRGVKQGHRLHFGRREIWPHRGSGMTIERTAFGSITIDGKTYEHDVIIRLSGEVVKRKKKLSKKYYGTSHVISKDEAKFVFEKGCEQLILGSGQMGNVHLSPEAEAYFAEKGCKVLLQPTPEALNVFNKSHAKKIGLFHVTC